MLKKLKNLFKGKKKPEEPELKGKKTPEEPEDQNLDVRVLMGMQYNIFDPANVLEPLLMAITMDTLKPATASLNDIKLYSLYNRENNDFVGSCYALKKDGRFYGNVVGSTYIITFKPEAYYMKETIRLYIPLNCKEDKMLVFESAFDKAVSSVKVLSLKWITKQLQTLEVLYEFDGGTSFKEAYRVYQKFDKIN